MMAGKTSMELPAPAWAKHSDHKHRRTRATWPIVASVLFAAGAFLFFAHSLSGSDAIITASTFDDVHSNNASESQHFSGKANESTQASVTNATTSSISNSTSTIPNRFCPELPNLDRVLLIFKTGATASHKRVPPHLETTLSCLPKSSYVLVSDLDEILTHDGMSYRLHDVLAPGASNSSRPSHVGSLHPLIPSRRLMDDPSFELYRALRTGKAHGRNLTKEIDSMSGAGLKEDGQGWKLDKWKFLPMLSFASDTVKDRSKIDWFFFVEADTYFSMRNLLLYLFPDGQDRFNPKQGWYLGSPTTFGGPNFAHGGSGFLLSRPALKAAVDVVENYPRKYEDVVDSDSAGDNVVARVLENVGILNTGIWPVIQGETPTSLDYLSGGDEDPIWCKQVTTWHHADKEIIESLWSFEQEWWKSFPSRSIRHKDIFWRFIMPELSMERESWDNDSQDQIAEYSKEMDEANEEEPSQGDLVVGEETGVQHDIQNSPSEVSVESTGASWADVPSDYNQHSQDSPSQRRKRDAQSFGDRAATLSFEGCRAMCEADESCMQFSFITGVCGTSQSIKLGKKLHGLVNEGRKSGWMLDRIRTKVAQLDDRCTDIY